MIVALVLPVLQTVHRQNVHLYCGPRLQMVVIALPILGTVKDLRLESPGYHEIELFAYSLGSKLIKFHPSNVIELQKDQHP